MTQNPGTSVAVARDICREVWASQTEARMAVHVLRRLGWVVRWRDLPVSLADGLCVAVAAVHHRATDAYVGEVVHGAAGQPAHSGELPEPGSMAAEQLDDAAFMDSLDNGVAAPLSLYWRAYAAAGVPWPGDDEVRRRHRVTTDDTPHDIPTSVQVLRWPGAE